MAVRGVPVAADGLCWCERAAWGRTSPPLAGAARTALCWQGRWGESSLPAHAGTGSRKQRLVPQCAFSRFPVAASQPSLKRPPPAPSRPSLMRMHAQR